MPKPQTVQEFKRLLREHEELETRLYTALISDHIPRGTDIRSELWDYAERMSGCVPEENEYDEEMGLYD